MRKPIVITLGIMAAAVVLGAVLVAAGIGYFYYTGNLDHNPERARGEEFGVTTDQKGCVDESVRRLREHPGSTFFERLDTGHIPSFTSGCFYTCKPTKEFCDGVPSVKDLLDGLRYQERKCQVAGLDNGICQNIFHRVIKECKDHKLKVVSYPD